MSSWPHLQASTVSYSLIINDPMLDEGSGLRVATSDTSLTSDVLKLPQNA